MLVVEPTIAPANGQADPSKILLENGFRSTRLNLKDLQKVADLVVGDQRWLCSKVVTLPAPDHVRRRTLTEWTAESLDELSRRVPSGRLFHFELQTQIDGIDVRISIGDRWSVNHRAVATASYGSNEVPPPAYSEIIEILHAAARRGRLWHYVSSTIIASLIFVAALMWRFGFESSGGDPRGDVGSFAASALSGIFLAALVFLFTFPLWLAGLRSLTASSIRLRPYAATHRVGSIARTAWAWLRSAYSRDGNMEYKTYLVAIAALVVATITLMVEIAK